MLKNSKNYTKVPPLSVQAAHYLLALSIITIDFNDNTAEYKQKTPSPILKKSSLILWIKENNCKFAQYKFKKIHIC